MRFLKLKKNEALKTHLLRFINQDEALHESQTDWFGKRGISWHITTATRMYEGQLQLLSLVHLFESCYQDSNTVLAVIDDELKQLKETMRKVDRVHFRQDNAGCYHSASTLLAIQQVAKSHDISIGLDFSDSQGKNGAFRP